MSCKIHRQAAYNKRPHNPLYIMLMQESLLLVSSIIVGTIWSSEWLRKNIWGSAQKQPTCQNREICRFKAAARWMKLKLQYEKFNVVSLKLQISWRQSKKRSSLWAKWTTFSWGHGVDMRLGTVWTYFINRTFTHVHYPGQKIKLCA